MVAHVPQRWRARGNVFLRKRETDGTRLKIVRTRSSSGGLQKTARNTFSAALVLTGSTEVAENAVLDGIAASEFDHIVDDVLLDEEWPDADCYRSPALPEMPASWLGSPTRTRQRAALNSAGRGPSHAHRIWPAHWPQVGPPSPFKVRFLSLSSPAGPFGLLRASTAQIISGRRIHL
jgi:hypothetical protein